MTKKELEDGFSDFYTNNFNKTVSYLVNHKKLKQWDGEDLANEIFKGFWESIEKTFKKDNNVSAVKWPNLLSKIQKNKLIDFYRFKTTQKEKNIFYTNKIEECFNSDNCFFRGNCDNVGSEIYNSEFLPWELREILFLKQRSVQDATIIFLTPSYEKIREVVRDEFKFTTNHYNIYKSFSYYLTYTDMNNGVPLFSEYVFSEENAKEMNIDFDIFVSNLANELSINDPAGMNALKIILLSKNPIKDLAICFSNQSVQKTYLSFCNDKLVKKDYVKNPYKHWFRDFLGYNLKTRGLKKLINKEKNKYPECLVSEEFIKKFFDLNPLSSEVIKKQIKGRNGKIGLKQKIEKYEIILKKTIKKL